MNRIKEHSLSILFLSLLVISIPATLYFIPSATNEWMSNNAPAWIQAIGSIAAIFAATLISSNQYKNEKRLEAERIAKSEIQKLMVVKALMARSYQLSKDITTAFTTRKNSAFDTVTPLLMVDTHTALMALPTFEIPDGLLSLDVLTIGRALNVLAEHWSDFCSSVTNNNHIDVPEAIPLQALAKEIEAITDDAIKICANEIAKRELITGINSGWGG